MKNIADILNESKVSNPVIQLNKKDMVILVELLFRGQAYSDMHYNRSDNRKMDRIWNEVINQLKQQGGIYTTNGEIKF